MSRSRKKLIIAAVAASTFWIINNQVEFAGYRNSAESHSSPLEIDKSKVISIDGLIWKGDVPPLMEMFLGVDEVTDTDEVSEQLIQYVQRGDKEVTFVINSGGGVMHGGMEVVDLMESAKQQGVTITCIINGSAMSMALIIFSFCDNRYATFGSQIMWHSVAQTNSGQLNAQSAATLLDYLQAANERVWARTRRHFLPWYFTKHFDNQSIIRASEVAANSVSFVEVIPSIVYVDPIKEIKADGQETTK